MILSLYNIHLGGTGRADPLAEVLLAAKPDIVILTEATDPDVIARLASRLHMDHASTHNGTTAVALLTSGELLQTLHLPPLLLTPRTPLLQATLRLPNLPPLTLFALELPPHLPNDPHTDHLRRHHLDYLLSRTAPLRASRTPHLIAGTLHALSPLQSPPTPSTSPNDILPTLLRHGYLDTFAHLHPHLAPTAGTFSTQNPTQRLDYILSYGLTIHTAHIETDRLATYASDHYPTHAQLSLP